MKLLLTSGGLKNKSIIDELRLLVGKDLKDCQSVYIPTAANVENGDKGWMINNLKELADLFGQVEIADIALPIELWRHRVEDAEVIVVGGGNTTYLIDQVRLSGFDKMLPQLLVDKVYVGISAGSMITTPTTAMNGDDVEKKDALGLVKFGMQPHFQASTFPVAETSQKVQRRIEQFTVDYPVYALDDESAVAVNDDVARVVSEGNWELFE